jgi:hypothetical protein
MSKGSGGGGGTQVTRIEPSTIAAPYLSGLYSDARNLYNQGGPQVFQGQTYANPTDTQLLGENLAMMNALGPQAMTAQNLTNAQNFALAGPANLSSNPYIAGATEAAIRPLYSQAQGLLQQARRDANSAGQLGGDRQAILEQGVIGDYLQKAGDITSTMYSDAYNNSLSNQAKAIGLAPSTLSSMSAPATSLMALGGVQQARDQLAIDDVRARFEAEQARPYSNLAAYQGIVGGDALGKTMTASMPGQSPSFGQRALGGAAAGLGAYQLAGLTTGVGTAAAPVFGPTIAGLAGPIGLGVGLASSLGLFD